MVMSNSNKCNQQTCKEISWYVSTVSFVYHLEETGDTRLVVLDTQLEGPGGLLEARFELPSLARDVPVQPSRPAPRQLEGLKLRHRRRDGRTANRKGINLFRN